MVTGYEVEMYAHIGRSARSLERIARSLERIADALEREAPAAEESDAAHTD